MKKLFVIAAVFMFGLNLNAQESDDMVEEQFSRIAISPTIMNIEQIDLNDLQGIFAAMNVVIEKKGKLAETGMSPFMLYLKYSFKKNMTVNADPAQQIDVLLDFYVVDIISKSQISNFFSEIPRPVSQLPGRGLFSFSKRDKLDRSCSNEFSISPIA